MNTIKIKCWMKCRDDLNISQTANYFHDQMKILSQRFDQFEWTVDFSKNKYDIREKETIKIIEKKTLSTANTGRYIKYKLEDFDSVTISKNFTEGLRDNSFSVRFNIGPASIGLKHNSIFIENTGKFKNLNTFEEYRGFIDLLVGMYSPTRIEIFHQQIFYKDFLVYSEIMEKLQEKLPDKKQMIIHGWMTYFGKDYPIPDLRDKFDMEVLSNGSKILYTTREEFDTEKHLEELIRINNYLLDSQIYGVHI